MEAGEFRHRVKLQSPTYVQDPVTGENVLSWADVQTVWAKIAPLRAREFIASQATQSEITTEIFIRYRTDVQPTWRVTHMVNGVSGTTYNIHGVMQDKTYGNVTLKMMCGSGVNDGE